MKLLVLIFLSFMVVGQSSKANCVDPAGVFSPQEGYTTTIHIGEDQTVEIQKEQKVIYRGKFTNFDPVAGHNEANAIDVKPEDPKQSHICLGLASDCSMMKAYVCRRNLEKFGGEPPSFETSVFWKND